MENDLTDKELCLSVDGEKMEKFMKVSFLKYLNLALPRIIKNFNAKYYTNSCKQILKCFHEGDAERKGLTKEQISAGQKTVSST